MRKRLACAAAVVVSAASLSGCLPQPLGEPFGVTPGTIVCDGGSGRAVVRPGITTTPQPITLTLGRPSTTAACVDGTGTGITSARIEHLSVTFPSLSCSGGTSPTTPTAPGSATIRWSDGTSSDASAVATLGGLLTGTLRLTVTSGHFTGMGGSSDFIAAPARGDCTAGIPAEDITLNTVTFSNA